MSVGDTVILVIGVILSIPIVMFAAIVVFYLVIGLVAWSYERSMRRGKNER